MANIFVNRHQYVIGDGLPAMSDFHFGDLEMTPQRSAKVKGIADS